MTSPRDRSTGDHTAVRSNAILLSGLRPRHFRPDTCDARARISQQRAPDHLQRLLARKPADALSVPGKVALHDLRPFFSRKRDIHQTDRLLLGATRRAGHSRDAYSVTRDTALPDAFRQRLGHLAADSSMFLDECFRYICKLRLQFVRINNRTAQKISRAPA